MSMLRALAIPGRMLTSKTAHNLSSRCWAAAHNQRNGSILISEAMHNMPLRSRPASVCPKNRTSLVMHVKMSSRNQKILNSTEKCKKIQSFCIITDRLNQSSAITRTLRLWHRCIET